MTKGEVTLTVQRGCYEVPWTRVVLGRDGLFLLVSLVSGGQAAVARVTV